MKFKLLLFSLVLIISLFLVSAFESPVYHIGVTVPSGDETGGVIIDSNTGSPNDGGGGGSSSKGSSSNSADNTIDLDTSTGDGDQDIISAGPEEEKKGFFSRITGAIIGAVGTTGAVGIFIFVVGIIGATIFVSFRKRK